MPVSYRHHLWTLGYAANLKFIIEESHQVGVTTVFRAAYPWYVPRHSSKFIWRISVFPNSSKVFFPLSVCDVGFVRKEVKISDVYVCLTKRTLVFVEDLIRVSNSIRKKMLFFWRIFELIEMQKMVWAWNSLYARSNVAYGVDYAEVLDFRCDVRIYERTFLSWFIEF